MVFEIKINLPLKKFKICPSIIIAGFLTFFYLIELGIGIRTLYYVFRIWKGRPLNVEDKTFVSWTLCVSCLLVSVCSNFIVNVISAIWEQKELKESGKKKSVLRFTFHIIVGGMIWRYISLWTTQNKDFTKRASLLLTMIKFLFTQSFTIPMIIVHVSVVENLQEICFVIVMVLCVSLTLLLTCTMFSCCSCEIQDIKKWNFETADFVPLIFCPNVPHTESKNNQNAEGSVVSHAEDTTEENKMSGCDKCKRVILKIFVLLQTFGFSFGRLLALGVLLKLAGIYAVSIMFLQLLISVIYLKFQAPILVSETLPKWRQLTRLAFMSYILIFEWHLKRDPKTGYCFSSNMKHSMIYYSIATTESIFYLITWAITVNYSTQPQFIDIKNNRNKFVRDTILIGILSLVLSLVMHFILLFWNSRKISVLVDSIKRKRIISKMRNFKHKNDDEVKNNVHHSCREISNPIPLESKVGIFESPIEYKCELEKYSSYCDLRESLDEDIEIYVRSPENEDGTRIFSQPISEEHAEVLSKISREVESSCEQNENHKMKVKNEKEVERLKTCYSKQEILLQTSPKTDSDNEESTQAAIIATSSSSKRDDSKKEKVTDELKKIQQRDDTPLKGKVSVISDNVTQKWSKFSVLSRKFTSSVREHMGKHKKQKSNNAFGIENLSDSPGNKMSKDNDDSLKNDCDDWKSKISSLFIPISNSRKPSEISDSGGQSSVVQSTASEEELKTSEGYFVGDERCELDDQPKVHLSKDEECLEEYPKTIEASSNDDTTENDEETILESNHKEGDSACSCYMCQALGENRFLRRRSLSVLPTVRKLETNSETIFAERQDSCNYLSSPNNVRRSQDLSDKSCRKDGSAVPRLYAIRGFKNLSLVSLDDRVEHYV